MCKCERQSDATACLQHTVVFPWKPSDSAKSLIICSHALGRNIQSGAWKYGVRCPDLWTFEDRLFRIRYLLLPTHAASLGFNRVHNVLNLCPPRFNGH